MSTMVIDSHPPDAGDPLAIPLELLDRHGLALGGGKARNLGALIRAGFPVPPGFVLTTRAYELVSIAAGLGPILEELARVRPSERERLSALAARAREAILATPLPEPVARALAEAHAALSAGEPVELAVRSSATAEDLQVASFAGQQDTYLGIVGREALEDAARRCMASLFTERAASYRADAGIDPRTVRLAVVVQQLVRARCAGVVFTANPITGRRRQAVLDVAPGLGESVVSGKVVPDHFVVDVAAGRILERRRGEGEAALTDAEALELAALGQRIEEHFGAPQDVEVALDAAGRIFVVQSRPITTLFPLPEGAPDPERELRVYFSGTADEGVVRPITPMGLQAFRLMASACADVFWGARPADPLSGPSVMVTMGERMFWDVTALVRNRRGRRLLAMLLEQFERETAEILRALLSDARLAEQRAPLTAILRAAVLPLVRTPLLPWIARDLISPSAAHRALRRAMERAYGAAGAEGAAGSAAGSRVAAVERAVFEVLRAIPLACFTGPIAGALALSIAKAALGARMSPDELFVALRALPDNPTTEMNLALWALAEEVRGSEAARREITEGDPAALARAYAAGHLSPALARPLSSFLGRYGHRAVAEIDLGLPRWSEDPTHILNVVKNYLLLEDRAMAPDALFRRAKADAEAKVAELERRARERSPIHGAAARFGLGRARALLGMRESGKDELSRLYARTRGALLGIGEELVNAQRIEDRRDVFFLLLPEVRAALEGADQRDLVRARRERYREELGRRRIPMIMLSDGTLPRAPEAAPAPGGEGSLTGTPASPGRVRGRARVVFDPEGARIEPGEILVAPSTDPGFTPLFLTAGGLVMEKGGAVSHGAVVAREYGIPAVVGVTGATARISTGHLLEVDGGAGRVTIVE